VEKRRDAAVSLTLNNRLILWGFVLGYVGVMGCLAGLAFGHGGLLAIKFVLVPVFVVGCALIGIAKFTPISDIHG
jgi:hypothetical protein